MMDDQRTTAPRSGRRRALLIAALAFLAAGTGVAFVVATRPKRNGDGNNSASTATGGGVGGPAPTPPPSPAAAPPPPDAEVGAGAAAAYDGTTSAPSTPSTPAPTPTFEPMTCAGTKFACRTDRVGHDQPLGRGQAICSRKNLFVFGLTHDVGSLVWVDCTTGETKTYYDGRSGDDDGAEEREGHSFVMRPDATLVVYGAGGGGGGGGGEAESKSGSSVPLLWSKPPPERVTVHRGCLHDPYFDCPYLHLHKNRGNVVLNRIEPGRGWLSDNIDRFYDF